MNDGCDDQAKYQNNYFPVHSSVVLCEAKMHAAVSE